MLALNPDETFRHWRMAMGIQTLLPAELDPKGIGPKTLIAGTKFPANYVEELHARQWRIIPDPAH